MGIKRNIFENEYVEALCLQYKRNKDFATYYRICDHLTNLMASIIRRNKYDKSAPFPDLMDHLYAQVGRWVLKWVPGEGKFYTYASISIKHGAISYISKEAQFKQRYQTMGDIPLDVAGSFHERYDLVGLKEAIKDDLAKLEVRWHEPEIREAVSVILYSLLDSYDDSKRKPLIDTISLGYNLDTDTIKFLIDWCQGSIRSIAFDHYSAPINESDVTRLYNRFDFLPELAEIIGIKNMRKVMTIFAGMNIRFPSVSQVKKTRKAARTLNGEAGSLNNRDWQDVESMVEKIRGGSLEDVSLGFSLDSLG